MKAQSKEFAYPGMRFRTRPAGIIYFYLKLYPDWKYRNDLNKKTATRIWAAVFSGRYVCAISGVIRNRAGVTPAMV